MDFPVYNLKQHSDGIVYDLSDNAQRHKYFKSRLGDKIEKLKEYLDNNTFIGFLVAKKGAGKGTYSGLFREIVGEDRVVLISIGDIVRDLHKKLDETPAYREDLKKELEPYYRGPVSIDTAIDALLNRLEVTDKVAVPTEFMLALIKKEVEANKNKAIFIDGFPRGVDQVSYSLYFRDIMNLRDDPDFFVLIDVSDEIIDARIKSRVICPKCKASRNLILLPTKFVEFDKEKNKYKLLCDNSACEGFGKQEMFQKEGDEFGIKFIKPRLDTDGALMEMIDSMHGIKKVLVRNAIPADKGLENAEEFELTKSYEYSADENGKVTAKEVLYHVKDDNGVDSFSLMSSSGVISMFNQIYDVLMGD